MVHFWKIRVHSKAHASYGCIKQFYQFILHTCLSYNSTAMRNPFHVLFMQSSKEQNNNTKGPITFQNEFDLQQCFNK